ncbi:MAG: hypothetical protein ACYCZR_11880 [Burkholderiales bacterium]
MISNPETLSHYLFNKKASRLLREASGSTPEAFDAAAAYKALEGLREADLKSLAEAEFPLSEVLLKRYTIHGVLYVSKHELDETQHELLVIYDRKGRRKSYSARTEKARTRASFGVHRSNLFVSMAEAEANFERFYQEMQSRSSSRAEQID